MQSSKLFSKKRTAVATTFGTAFKAIERSERRKRRKREMPNADMNAAMINARAAISLYLQLLDRAQRVKELKLYAGR